MKKVVLKEFDKCYLAVDIIFYNLICIVGLLIVTTKGLELVSLIKYFYLVFFVIAFISVLAYFSNRKDRDYEFLLYAFINVYVGTFALVYINYQDPWLILGCAMLVYTIANTLNRGFNVKKLDECSSSRVIVKFAVLVLVSVLSFFVAINLFSHEVIGNEIIGYYFLGFGLISLIEPYMCILSKNEKFASYICKDKKEKKEEKEEVKEEKKKVTVQKREVKKPVTKKKK